MTLCGSLTQRLVCRVTPVDLWRSFLSPNILWFRITKAMQTSISWELLGWEWQFLSNYSLCGARCCGVTFWQVCLTSEAITHKSTENRGQAAGISLWHLMKQVFCAFRQDGFWSLQQPSALFHKACNVTPLQSRWFLTVLAVGCQSFIAFCWIPPVYCNTIKIVTIW